jgi:hypothetical protein
MMGRKVTAALIVVGGTAVALLAGPDGPLGGLWRPTELDSEPAGSQVAGLAVAGVTEAVGFGLALAVLAMGRPAFVRLTASPRRARVALICSAWLLGSWWPHSALHRHFGLAVGPLVSIELAFHAGSVVAASLLIWSVLSRRSTRTAVDSA